MSSEGFLLNSFPKAKKSSGHKKSGQRSFKIRRYLGDREAKMREIFSSSTAFSVSCERVAVISSVKGVSLILGLRVLIKFKYCRRRAR